jgi:acyl-coenzyme A thioesterase PaaI-like protein
VHLGRTTQVWDAEVSLEGSEKTLALFRCTQMLLWAK